MDGATASDGCGCASSGRAVGLWWLVAALALIARRRRVLAATALMGCGPAPYANVAAGDCPAEVRSWTPTVGHLLAADGDRLFVVGAASS